MEDLSSYSQRGAEQNPALVPSSDGTTDAMSMGAAPSSPTPSTDCEGGCATTVVPLDEGDATGSNAADAGGTAVPNTDAGTSPSCAAGATRGPGNRCFALSGEQVSWAAARSDCRDLGDGWDLAEVRDLERNAWLALLMLVGDAADAWVGASDSSSEGTWLWNDDAEPFWRGTGAAGSSVGGAYENWNNGTTPEPNGGDASDCMRLRSDGGWADIECASAFASLCEGPLL
jgi:hypothetical protein